MNERLDTLPAESSNEEKAESRAKGIQETARFLDHALAGIPLDSAEKRMAFIRSLTPEGFMSLLNRLNGILRQLPIKDEGRDFVYGSEMVIQGFEGARVQEWVAPDEHSKAHIFSELLKSVQKQGEIEDAAKRIPEAEIVVHPHQDANGRTAQVAKFILKNGYASGDGERLVEYLSSKEGKERIINFRELERTFFSVLQAQFPEVANFKDTPFVFSPFMFEEEEPKAIERIKEMGMLDTRSLNRLSGLARDPWGSGMALILWHHATGKYPEEYNDFVKRQPVFIDEKGNMTPLPEGSEHILDFGTDSQLLRVLTDKDLGQIVNIYWETKRMMTEHYLRCGDFEGFGSPGKENMKIASRPKN